MTCFCSAKLSLLFDAVAAIPPTANLIPPQIFSVVGAVNASMGASAATVTATATAAYTLMGAGGAALPNLSAMASASAAMKAAFGMNLSAALSASAVATLNAKLTAAINGFNANGVALVPHLDLLARLQVDLMGLVSLAGAVTAIQTAYGIDLRAPGALAAVQARLAAGASANVSVPGLAFVFRPALAVVSLLATLGFKADVQGAAAVGAQAQALASLTAALPPMNSGFAALALLSNVLAMVAAIRLSLGVDLLSPSAAIDLRAVMALLPVEGLAQLNLSLTLSASVSVASAYSEAMASVAANAVASLDLSATANAHLSGLLQVTMLVQVMVQGGLSFPAGACGGPCPLALAAVLAVSGAASAVRSGSVSTISV